MELPRDPMMLLSVVNTKLRDRYASLDALCEDLGVEKTVIMEKLAAIGYAYDEALNRLV